MTDLFNNDMTRGAEFSKCRNYRYCLWRIWDLDMPKVMFIGLNPSTANEQTDDPTIRRVISFAKSWGFGGVYMMNLFAWVTAYPEELQKCKDPVGENDFWLRKMAGLSQKTVFAWGNFKEAVDRGGIVSAIFPDAYALQLNKNGSPKHPLYVKGDTEPIKFKQVPKNSK